MSKIKFVFLFFGLLLSTYTGLYAQTDLVIWNDHTSTPTPEVANITANQMVLGGGVTISNNGWSGFRVNNFHNGSNNTINYSKYIEFRVTPDNDYKIVLSQFKLLYNSPSGAGPTKLQVRYSTNPAFPSNGTLLGSEQTLTTNSEQSITLNFPSSYEVDEALYIRLYLFGHPNIHYTDFFIRNTVYNPSTPGPTITGTVLSALPPEAVDDNESTAENTPADFDILANDTYSTLSAITIVDQPDHGSNITVNGLTDVTYTPDTSYTGSDSFTYTITDENGTSDEATVNITISTPTPPTAVADVASTLKNHSISSINVLANDSPGSGAFDYVTKISDPSHGVATINPDNKTFSYTPTTDYTGSDSFQYNVTNVQDLTSNTVTVTINVNSTENLAIWNNTNFTPTAVGNITASNITIAGSGLTLTHTSNSATNDFFEASNNWPSGSIDLSKYVEFTISPDAGYKIELDRFNFYYKSQGGQNFQVRYSKNNFSSFTTMIGDTSVPGTWTSASNTFSSGSPILPGETLKIRIYAYNTYQVFQIKRYLDTSQPTDFSHSPRITGRVVSLDQADLEVTKTVDDSEPDPLDDVTFTITATNNGPDNASGVEVNDLLPSGFSYVSHSATSGTYDQVSGIWTIGSLDDEDVETLTVTATVLSTGDYENTATISGDDEDLNLANNTDSATAAPYFPEADLEITKSINNATPDVGQNITFTLTATNNGPEDAGGVLVTDILPTGYEYVSSTPSVGTYDEETGEWTIGTLADEATATLQIIAEVLPYGIYENTATISGVVDDDTPGNDTDTVDITNVVDIAITKTVDEPTPDILTNVIFTIEVENLSTNDATGVVVTDVIPSGYNYVSNTGGASYNATTKTVTWTVGDLDASDTDSFTITAEVKAGGNHTNTATVAATEPDDASGNNSDSASVVPDLGNAVDLQITQEVDDEEPNISATVTFTITAENNGPNPATGVVSNIRIANGLQYLSATASAGTSYNSGTGVWTIGAMANAATATLEIDATVLSGDGAAYLTIAEITGNEEAYDSDIINNTAYAILTPNGQTFLECDVNAENPVFRQTFGTGAPTFKGELADGRTNLEYQESPPNIEDGQYTIAKNAQNGASNWQSITDASGTPNGYFMIVNADLEPHEFFRIRIDLEEEFCSNTQYTVNFSAINVNSEENYDYCTNNEGGLILPEIGYFIQNNNGEVLGAGTSGEIPYSATAQWQDYNFIFTTSESDEYVDLVIFNKAPGGCGNDLAIDDITMYACMTPPIQLDMAIESDQLEVCGGEDVTMTVVYTPSGNYQWPPAAWSPDPEDVEYRWQRSDDQVTWTDIPGEVNDTLVIPDFAEADQAYYRLLYAQEGNIDKASCRFPSEDLFPVFNATPVLGDIEADVDDEELCVGDGPFQLTSEYDTSGYVDEPWGPDFYDWESSNNSVATVDEDTGMLTPVAAGSVTITYTVLSPKGECEGSTQQTFIIRNEECEEVTPSRLITNPMIRSRVIAD
mgnify:FL=1